MFKDKRINMLFGLGLCVAVVALLMFDFSSVAVENGLTVTFNGLQSVMMLLGIGVFAEFGPEIVANSPDVLAMALVSLAVIILALLIMIFIALYAMYKKHWMMVTYNILVQLLFLGAIAFIAPFIIAEDRAYSANRDAIVNISIYAPQIIMWAVALVGCFMATVMSYGHKALLMLLYFVMGMGILMMPIMAAVASGRDNNNV